MDSLQASRIFSDPLMDCKECHERFRADKIIEDYCHEKKIPLSEAEKQYGSDAQPLGSVDSWTKEQMEKFIEDEKDSLPVLRKSIILRPSGNSI